MHVTLQWSLSIHIYCIGMSYSSEEEANPKQFACTQNRDKLSYYTCTESPLTSPCQLEVKYMQALLIKVLSNPEKPLFSNNTSMEQYCGLGGY